MVARRIHNLELFGQHSDEALTLLYTTFMKGDVFPTWTLYHEWIPQLQVMASAEETFDASVVRKVEEQFKHAAARCSNFLGVLAEKWKDRFLIPRDEQKRESPAEFECAAINSRSMQIQSDLGEFTEKFTSACSAFDECKIGEMTDWVKRQKCYVAYLKDCAKIHEQIAALSSAPAPENSDKQIAALAAKLEQLKSTCDEGIAKCTKEEEAAKKEQETNLAKKSKVGKTMDNSLTVKKQNACVAWAVACGTVGQRFVARLCRRRAKPNPSCSMLAEPRHPCALSGCAEKEGGEIQEGDERVS